MSAKQMKFDADARLSLLSGAEQIARAVAVTMGPTGRHVVLQKSFGGPSVTKDGVSVAREVELSHPFENMGAKMVHQVAKKTADVAGDGTTAATVLAHAILEQGLKQVATGANAVAIQRGVVAAAEVACGAVDDLSKPCKKIDELRKVATVSANHDRELGGMIAQAIDTVGADGVVEVEEGKSLETTLDFVEGMSFDKGWLSPYFMTDPKAAECVLEDVRVLVHEKKISNLADLLPLLNKIATDGKPILIIAEEVENEALAALVVNQLRGVLKVAAVKAPGFGDRRKAMLGDIAVMTGATFFSEDLGRSLEEVELKELGTAKKIVVNKDSTVIVEGAGKKSDVKARVGQIEAQIEQSSSDYDREKLQERLAKLTGGVAVLSVGGHTEVEMKERKDRVDDAIHATRAAAKEGFVPGGGVAALRAITSVSEGRRKGKGDEKLGYDIMAEALRAPARQISENAGHDGDVVVEKVLDSKGAHGFNAGSGTYEDLVRAGILDPALVVKTCIRHAASVAGLMLTTDVLLTDLEEKAEPATGATA